MRGFRIYIILTGVSLMGVFSCEKCKKCSYTYTVTSIEQTVNGEQEVVNTYTGYVVLNDSVTLSDECIKGDESFTIEQHYINKGDTTVLDNYSYTCTDL